MSVVDLIDFSGAAPGITSALCAARLLVKSSVLSSRECAFHMQSSYKLDAPATHAAQVLAFDKFVDFWRRLLQNWLPLLR